MYDNHKVGSPAGSSPPRGMSSPCLLDCSSPPRERPSPSRGRAAGGDDNSDMVGGLLNPTSTTPPPSLFTLPQSPRAGLVSTNHQRIVNIPPLSSDSEDSDDCHLLPYAERRTAKANRDKNIHRQSITSACFPTEKLKCFVAFVLGSSCMSLTALLVVAGNDRVPAHMDPLPDLVFDLVPRVSVVFKYAEYIGLFELFVWCIVVLFHRHRFILMRRYFLIVGLLYLYRGVTLFMTTLPNPYQGKECSTPAGDMRERLMRWYNLQAGGGLSITGQLYCGDYIYSGHALTIVVLTLFIREYSPSLCSNLGSLISLLSTVGVASIVVSREHYSIDVVIAYYITTRVFWFYHAVANMPSPKQRHGSPTNYLSREWTYLIVRYFECKVPGPVPNEFESPFLPLMLWIREHGTQFVNYIISCTRFKLHR